MLWSLVSLTGDVLLAQYRTAAFLAKNRDFVVGEHQALLQASADPFIAALFPAEAEANGNAPVRAESVMCSVGCVSCASVLLALDSPRQFQASNMLQPCCGLAQRTARTGNLG